MQSGVYRFSTGVAAAATSIFVLTASASACMVVRGFGPDTTFSEFVKKSKINRSQFVEQKTVGKCPKDRSKKRFIAFSQMVYRCGLGRNSRCLGKFQDSKFAYVAFLKAKWSKITLAHLEFVQIADGYLEHSPLKSRLATRYGNPKRERRYRNRNKIQWFWQCMHQESGSRYGLLVTVKSDRKESTVSFHLSPLPPIRRAASYKFHQIRAAECGKTKTNKGGGIKF